MDGYILVTGQPSTLVGGRADPASDHGYASTPHLQRRSISDGPPVFSVLCAVKTPSGKSIAASFFSDTIDVDNDGLTDVECIERCMDQCWEPAIFNLGQSYRKLKRYGEAIVCFEKCTSLNPASWYLVTEFGDLSCALNMSLTNISHDIKNKGTYAAYAALGFAKHLNGDVDGAIDSYHEALSRKPEDPFTSEMLTRALSEAVTYPPSLAMLSSFPSGHDEEVRFGGIGSSIFNKPGNSRKVFAFNTSENDQDLSMIASNINDVDMSLT
jgi:tetratricopeptide (TPR) repeat protein